MGADQLAVDPVEAAHRLLGATLTGRGVSAMIVEVEAYGGVPDGPWPDAAAHSYRGVTGRSGVMFGPPGRLYAYLSHGIHVCANVVCATDGVAAAVLLRAAAVETGLDVALARRGASIRPRDLARGPGNLCAAVGITMADNGIDLFDASSPVRLELNDAVDATIGAPRRRQPGRRPAVAAVACGTAGGLRLPTQSSSACASEPATKSGAPAGKVPCTCAKIYDCGR